MGQDLNHVRRTDWISVGKKLWTGGVMLGEKSGANGLSELWADWGDTQNIYPPGLTPLILGALAMHGPPWLLDFGEVQRFSEMIKVRWTGGSWVGKGA